MTATALTQDAFLGGKLHLWQPAKGYRAGVDPVLLAASVDARQGQSVLELGCGAGAASLCLATRVDGLVLTGDELQPDYAELARRNAQENGISFQVVEADLRNLPQVIRNAQFDHVIANPPYYARDKSTPSVDAGRDIALAGATPLTDWVEVAAKRLAPKGYLTVIQRVDRLPELLEAVASRLGSIRVKPIQPRQGRAAQLVLVQARKGGRADFVLDAPLVMHQGAQHEEDGESYTSEVQMILRKGHALRWD